MTRNRSNTVAPFMAAARDGDVNSVCAEVVIGHHPNTVAQALSLAMTAGHDEIVDVLIPLARDPINRWGLLSTAATQARQDWVQSLLPRCKPLGLDPEGLVKAASLGDLDVVQSFLVATLPGSSHNKALLKAVEGGRLLIVKALVAARGQHVKNDQALGVAASKNELEIAKVLLAISTYAAHDLALNQATMWGYEDMVALVLPRCRSDTQIEKSLSLSARMRNPKIVALLAPRVDLVKVAQKLAKENEWAAFNLLATAATVPQRAQCLALVDPVRHVMVPKLVDRVRSDERQRQLDQVDHFGKRRRPRG